MKAGLIFSLVAHTFVGVVSFVGLPALKRDFRGPPEMIPVEFVAIDDVTRNVTPPAPQIETEAEQTPAPADTPPDPVRQVTEAVPTDAMPLPDAKPEPKVEAPEPVRPRPSVTPRTKPRPPSSLNAGRLAALIDRSKEEAEVVIPEPEDTNLEQIEDAVARNQPNTMDARRATATLQAVIRQKVEACWSVPVGAKDADDLQVRLKIFLRQDGTLQKPPEYMDAGRLSDPFYRTAAESAARAVRRCAPYDLPKDQYNIWRELIFTFDPKELLEGK